MTTFVEPQDRAAFDAHGVVVHCVEAGAQGILLDAGHIPSEFFDLSSGVAGELLHHLSKYHLRLAAVVPDPSAHSLSFQAFVREANLTPGDAYRFFSDRRTAIAWLEAD